VTRLADVAGWVLINCLSNSPLPIHGETEEMSVKISINQSTCSGYANCVVAAPEVFDLDGVTGKAVVLEANPESGLEDEVREAARVCPVGAVIIDDGQ
jgi:ferredoxin